MASKLEAARLGHRGRRKRDHRQRPRPRGAARKSSPASWSAPCFSPRASRWPPANAGSASRSNRGGGCCWTPGPSEAIQRKGRSLLAIGVVEVEGSFAKGDVVALPRPDGGEIARGLTNYGHEDLRKIKGLRTGQIAAVLGRLPLRRSDSSRQHGDYRRARRAPLDCVRKYIVRMSGDGECSLRPTHHPGRQIPMESFDNLTERQQAVYEFIRDKIRGRGYGPTVREIGRQFRHQLAQRGGLPPEGPGEEGADHPRAEHVAGDPTGGRADRGPQSAAWPGGSPPACSTRRSSRTSASISTTLFDPADKDLFVLEVNGESMIEDQIADGDYVVVRRQQKTARKGQIVVAITDEGEATLKRWFPEKNRIRLEPANADHEADLRPRRARCSASSWAWCGSSSRRSLRNRKRGASLAVSQERSKSHGRRLPPGLDGLRVVAPQRSAWQQFSQGLHGRAGSLGRPAPRPQAHPASRADRAGVLRRGPRRLEISAADAERRRNQMPSPPRLPM